MKKRLLSVLLAATMTMGATSISAFAEDINNMGDLAGTQSFEASGEAKVPTINITVPTTGTIVLDPFNLEQNGQITSADFKIINNSDIPVSVSLTEAKATTQADTFKIVSKALTTTDKWAVININITDGLNKTTSKVLDSTDAGQNIAVSTPMAPLGGIVKYKYSGTAALNPEEEWTNSDKITVSNTFSFTMNTVAKYHIIKSFSAVNDLTVANGTEEANLGLPETLIGDSKIEFPVEWQCVDADGNEATYEADTAGAYTFQAVIPTGNEKYYSSAIELPKVTVTVEEAV